MGKKNKYFFLKVTKYITSPFKKRVPLKAIMFFPSTLVLPTQVFFTYQGQEDTLVPNARMVL